MTDLLTRDEFERELQLLAERLDTAAIRALRKIPWEKWAPHLQADVCKKIGVEPVMMFRRTADPTTEVQK